MRTTLNLDADVAAQLTAISGRRGTSLSRVANDLIRAGLAADNDRAPLARYEGARSALRTGLLLGALGGASVAWQRAFRGEVSGLAPAAAAGIRGSNPAMGQDQL